MSAKKAAKPKAPKISVVRTERVPIAKLKPMPGNARRGDVDAIEESVDDHGQYKPIVANLRTRHILVGNHTMRGMKRKGATDILVSWVDVTRDEEREINLVDNATSDRATTDERALAKQLEAVRAAGRPVTRTGYSERSVDSLLARVRAASSVVVVSAGDQTSLLQDSFRLIVTCRNERQQAALIDRLVGEGYDVRALVT